MAGAANPQLAATFSNPAALQRVWQATLATLKRSKAAYGVLFLGTKASYDAASNVFNIEFPAENAFAFKAVQKPDVQASVGQALSQACGGQQVPFALTQAGSAAAPRAVQVPPAAAAAVGAPAVAPAAVSQPRQQPASQLPAQQSAPQFAAPSVPATRPQPAPVPRPASAPAPQAVPARASQSRRAADVPPWEDEQVPYDDAMAVSFDEDVQEGMSAPSRSQAPAAPQAAASPSRPQPAPAPAPSAPAAASAQRTAPAAPAAAFTPAQAAQSQAPAPAPEAAAQPAQTGSDTTVDDLQSILQAGFGGGVTFEEVD